MCSSSIYTAQEAIFYKQFSLVFLSRQEMSNSEDAARTYSALARE
jgi:hypothetical protein